ncbi:MAG: glucokinase [Desulfitobacterium sp.]|nr:glucokinase [Desulfitobacterium sp.]
MANGNSFSGHLDFLIFAADIGGTNTRLSILNFDTKFTILNKEEFATSEWTDLSTLINSYLSKKDLQAENIYAGCLSLAGPIRGDSCLLTNSKQIIDFNTLKNSLSFQFPLLFVNDLEGMGRGISLLASDDLLPLIHSSADPFLSTSFNPSLTHSAGLSSSSPSENHGHKALIAPGTGLGEAMITENGEVYTSEGGHGDFAPRTEKEVDLWHFLNAKYGHVSYERVLSGEGIENIYEFLSLNVRDKSISGGNLPAPEITKKALEGVCPLCVETLKLFVSILGAEAGNLALRTLARGGVYLGGGIPKKIIPFLKEDSIKESFLAKGRMKEFLGQIPIFVILNENAPLLGAAQIALDTYLGQFK